MNSTDLKSFKKIVRKIKLKHDEDAKFKKIIRYADSFLVFASLLTVLCVILTVLKIIEMVAK